MFPSEEVHVGVCHSSIFLLPLPERSEKEENWESDVSSAREGLSLRKVGARYGRNDGLHIRYKFWSFKWLAFCVNKRIKSFEEHHNPYCDEGEPRRIWLETGFVWEFVP